MQLALPAPPRGFVERMPEPMNSTSASVDAAPDGSEKGKIWHKAVNDWRIAGWANFAWICRVSPGLHFGTPIFWPGSSIRDTHKLAGELMGVLE
jgi:hypothetical protein